MSAWSAEQGLSGVLSVASGWPPQSDLDYRAAIVVNAARDHEGAAQWAIENNIPVLIEKPIAVTARAARSVEEAARRKNSKIAAAHVFLFASYLDNFARRVGASGELRSIDLHWADPAGESRYGETKRYDPGLPVFADCLPHALAILGRLTDEVPVCLGVRVARGGAAVTLDLMLGKVTCRVHLARNATGRRRTVEAVTVATALTLDFTREPGLIQENGATVPADPEWNTAPRPVSRMLSAFLAWIAEGRLDQRLDIGPGVRACEMIETVAALYSASVLPWLRTRLGTAATLDDDVRYALAEMLHAGGPPKGEEGEARLRGILVALGAPAEIISSALSDFAVTGVKT
jgi:predicted dehydrogenase